MRRRGTTRSGRVRSDSLISEDLRRSNTVSYNPHLCKQNDDEVCPPVPLGPRLCSARMRDYRVSKASVYRYRMCHADALPGSSTSS